jgi:hypothetical protein
MDNETQFEDGLEQHVSRTVEEKLCARTKEHLSGRHAWEKRQDIWYKMRHHGLRRMRMPFPNAADLHYPLIDTAIEKLTPFYLQQFTSAALLADFIATDGVKERPEDADSAARYFDYYLKHKTNFEDEHEPLIDAMLLGGRSILKIRWDSEEDELNFDTIDPLFFIVPPMTKKLQKADFITEVIQLSPEQYKNISVYKQDEDFIKKLLTKGDENGDGEETNEAKYQREGLTSPDDKTIVIWQTYRKEWIVEKKSETKVNPLTGQVITIEVEEKVKRVRVYTYAPHMPNEPVRAVFTLPYAHNEYPFVDFPREEKEKRWYAPRGVSERLAPFEAYICKVWNEKADAMTFYNNPIYTTNGQTIANPSNIRFTPGSVFTTAIQRIDSGNPPISFDQEMINTRVTAESLEQVPDFGMGKQQDFSQRRTATEIQAISQMSSASQDARAGLFRKRLKAVYKQAWALIKQFAKDSKLEFIQDGEQKIADSTILQRSFEISPAGAANSWNKQYKANVALQILNVFRNDPNINQIALKKIVIENLTPEHLAELIIDPMHEQVIRKTLQDLQNFEAQGGVVPPEAKKQALDLIQHHFNAIKSANPQAAAMLAQQLGQALQPQQAQLPPAPANNGGQM